MATSISNSFNVLDNHQLEKFFAVLDTTEVGDQSANNKEIDAGPENKEGILLEDIFLNRLVISTPNANQSGGKSEFPIELEIPEKVSLTKDAELVVKVTHIASPSEFYICPIGLPTCMCTSTRTVDFKRWEGLTLDDIEATREKDVDPKSVSRVIRNNIEERKYNLMLKKGAKVMGDYSTMEEYEYDEKHPSQIQQKYIGTEGLYRIITDLSDFIEIGIQKKVQRDSGYEVGELVAVQVEFKRSKLEVQLGGRRFYWLRGVVSEIFEGLYKYKIYLFDYGASVQVSQRRILLLPQAFMENPALVYKCKLFETEPAQGVWSDKHTQAFRKLVDGKMCYMEVISGSKEELQTSIEKHCYKVTLNFHEKKSVVHIRTELRKLPGVLNTSFTKKQPIPSKDDWKAWNRLNQILIEMEKAKTDNGSPSAKAGNGIPSAKAGNGSPSAKADKLEIKQDAAVATKEVKPKPKFRPFTVGSPAGPSFERDNYKSPYFDMTFSQPPLCVSKKRSRKN